MELKKMTKRLITTELLLHLSVLIATAQQNCSYCGGTGKIVKNISVSRYGAADYKVKCPTCGAVTMKSTGHSHIHCQYCGGTGRRNNNSSSRKNSSGRTLDDIAMENPEAFSTAMSIRYGIPMDDSELTCVRGLDSQLQTIYMRLRNILENDIIFCNQSIAMSWYKNMNVNSVNQKANDTYSKIQSIFQEINNYIGIHPSCGWTNQMNKIAETHTNKCQSSFQQLYNLVKLNQGMQQMQDQLWREQLYKNLF